MDYSLRSKYLAETGTILLSGVQALVRLPLDQHRADRARGVRTATLVSGYRGSPLGGLDLELQRNRDLLDEHDVRFLPAVNEELGATAIMGSQIAALFPRPRYEGVVGLWYGKAPGVDRTGDVLKHGNFTGVTRTGGVLAIAGDDATAKSSTLPSQSEAAFYDALMPVLMPGSVQEVLDLGLRGIALSRYSGSWVGLKVATEVADAFETATVAPERNRLVYPELEIDGRPWRATQSVFLAAPVSLGLEREIHRGRLAAARAFSRANQLNRIVVSSPHDRLGIAASGTSYLAVREALDAFGLDDEGLRRFGIRLFKVAMPYPLDEVTAREFARGLEEIVVVEEKRSFLELFLREALYDEAARPRIVGKTDDAGAILVPPDGALDADVLAEALQKPLSARVPAERLSARLGVLGYLREQSEEPPSSEAKRLFHFCSGCPHNRSTVVPQGSLAGAGIGCHAMAMMMDGSTVGITQMGGEGVQWVGMAPFTETPHLFQNLGDGTLFHSGSLAIRQAVAAGTNITFKVLYNGAVAMTGGQHVDGAMSIPNLVKALEAEGVRRILVLSDDPSRIAAEGDASFELWERGRLDEAQTRLRETPGTTVLIYDQYCAAELRRLRRRGLAEEPAERIFINEEVCEGCGDCGVKSNCLSLHPVETELGRKTRVHQSSCNKDYSCIDGDCPSFVRVVPGAAEEKPLLPDDAAVPLPRPSSKPRQAQIYMVGIGGTGVVTVNQVLGTAALLEGLRVVGLDQTGLSQKGGPVTSHLKLLAREQPVSNRIAAGEADLYLVFDVLTGGSPAHLTRARRGGTVAVVSTSVVPTGAMVSNVEASFPSLEVLTSRIDAHTRVEDNVFLDAVALAERFFGDHMPANLLLVGAAYQKGLLPLEKWSIEKAIELNGVAVAMNRAAFQLGRRAVADPAWLREITAPEPTARSVESHPWVAAAEVPQALQPLLSSRVAELVAYQNEAYARAYLADIAQVLARDRALDGLRLTETAARNLFKLMAYKDEYEVARLHTKKEALERLRSTFGEGARYAFLLHPPALRAVGLETKIPFGSWSHPLLRALSKLKFLRGTAFDPFGYARVRREERAIREEYRSLLADVLPKVTRDNYDAAVALAALPDVVRGYEQVKLRNIERFRTLYRERKEAL